MFSNGFEKTAVSISKKNAERVAKMLEQRAGITLSEAKRANLTKKLFGSLGYKNRTPRQIISSLRSQFPKGAKFQKDNALEIQQTAGFKKHTGGHYIDKMYHAPEWHKKGNK